MLNLVHNRKSEYCIALPKEPSIVETTTAGELASYIEKSSGVLLSIVSEEKVNGNAIYIGHTQYAKDNHFLGDSVENWMVCVSGQNVVLTGGLTNKDRGVAYSVYHFLEDIVGIRWWSWFEEYVPETDDILISETYQNSGTPYFEYRNIVDTFDKADFAYVARNRLNAWTDNVKVDAVCHNDFISRGGIKYIGLPAASHTMAIMLPIDDYYDEHPEWFAYEELSGTRPRTSQHATLYCHTNEGLIKATADKVIENIEKNKILAEENGLEMPYFFSVTTSDVPGRCECENCKKIYNKSGESGYNIQFVNAVAKHVAKKFPDVLLVTFAYWDFIDPPKDDTAPDKNVLIQYADLKIDILRDIESETNREALRLFDSWSKICAKNNSAIYIWDYFLQQYPNCIMPYFFRLSKNYRYFYEKGAKSCFIEHEVSHLSDFWTMTQWLLTRVLENPYQNYNALVDDFVTRYYGDAASYIKQYISLLEKNLSENACRVMVFEQANMTNYVNYETIKNGLEILSSAEKAVKHDDLRLKRVHTVMTCLYRTLIWRYDEFLKIAEGYNETIELSKEEAAENLIKYMKENTYMYIDDTASETHNTKLLRNLQREIEYIECFLAKPKPDIKFPKELLKYGKENIYSIAGTEFFGLAGCGMLPEGHQMGEKIEYSEELGYEILKLSPLEIPLHRRKFYLAGSRNDTVPNPMAFYTEGNCKNVCLELYQEDLIKDEFALYNVGEVTGVSAKSSTIFRLFDYLGYCTGISNLYESFPCDTYRIYINLKATGAVYGGSEVFEDALYIDAVHIVRIPEVKSKEK